MTMRKTCMIYRNSTILWPPSGMRALFSKKGKQAATRSRLLEQEG